MLMMLNGRMQRWLRNEWCFAKGNTQLDIELIRPTCPTMNLCFEIGCMLVSTNVANVFLNLWGSKSSAPGHTGFALCHNFLREA